MQNKSGRFWRHLFQLFGAPYSRGVERPRVWILTRWPTNNRVLVSDDWWAMTMRENTYAIARKDLQRILLIWIDWLQPQQSQKHTFKSSHDAFEHLNNFQQEGGRTSYENSVNIVLLVKISPSRRRIYIARIIHCKSKRESSPELIDIHENVFNQWWVWCLKQL